MTGLLRPFAALAVALVTTASALTHAQAGAGGPGAARTGPGVQDGVFTAAQAARGEALYTQECASCHGPALKGASAPPLTGDVFVSRWQPEPLSALFTKINKTMPADAPGKLSPQQAADLVAHLLKSGGFPAGKTELAANEAAISRIGWPVKTAAQTASGPGRSYPPVGNLAQLMRGVFFPNANMIFTVQTHDPAAPVKPVTAEQQANGFSWVDWGAGIYGGWQLVDNAAIALADISPIMLNPELRCENGKPAPVTDPDWIKFTEQMITVAKNTYRVSQSRNQEAVSDATGDLSDTCAACHQVYRDVAPRGRAADPTNPQTNSARCTHR